MIAQVYGKRGATALHRFDPRAKVALLLAFLVVFFLPIRLWHLAGYLAFLSALSAGFLGIPNTLRPIRLIAPILLLVLLLTPPFYREGRVLLAVRGLTVLSLPGLLVALRLMIRFSGITLIFYMFIGTTSPDDLVLAFRWFRLPFNVSLVLSLALEYIPAIRTIYDQVQDAHRLRLAGGEHGGGKHGGGTRATKSRVGLIRRLAEAVPAMTSVLVLSVRRIPTLAMALECRGVGRSGRRSSYHSLKTGVPLLRDFSIAAALVAALIVSVLLFH
ncbi:MAG: energy-coupling factor transporter transmembrane protein EcfT [Spirochaetales bacterium]|nr:energy-coupling factor transporter transmembrane protein EcfT [Spirochaetales bacterium]